MKVSPTLKKRLNTKAESMGLSLSAYIRLTLTIDLNRTNQETALALLVSEGKEQYSINEEDEGG
jgi:antitoxin component of RelBE/YafQ-DinJ toxin-antitoxin module